MLPAMRDLDGKLEAELKRGILQIAVLSLLSTPRYGYQIGRILADNGLAVEEGTLYPILRRLEEQGLLESRWVTEQARPRKYYTTTADGRESLVAVLQSWQRVDDALRRILDVCRTSEGTDAGAQTDSPAGDVEHET
jgi:DNA-binding PadR family transcriptional regulator